jgi:NAD(P)-dependent dehydrogenase (short-subunit alcohol dehydrogenase family)
MKAIVISATSDIATEMCVHWAKKGWTLSGTYLSQGANYKKLMGLMKLFPCDLLNKDSIDETAQLIGKSIKGWELIIFAAGSLMPVGSFDQVDIDEWIASIHLNFIHQIRMLRNLLPYRDRQAGEKTVLFFAGGGTNTAVVNYSAYTVSKIALIKMCELLDAEIPDVKFSIIGPGWVKTKIHHATIQAGKAFAGDNFEKLKKN